MPDPVRYFDGAPPRSIAHRGLALHAQENTLEAFAAALDAGADILETDVHASADGVAVICHDDDLSRIAGVDAPVEQLASDELLRLSLVGGGRLATLAETLERFPRARFNIDVKTDAALSPTVAAVGTAGAQQRVLIASFAQRRRRRAVRALAGAATSASTPGVALALMGTWLRLPPLVRLALRDVDAVQVPRRQGSVTVVSPSFVRAVHDAGREVHVWTVNDPDEMRELLSMGVDGIITDRCDLLAGVLDGPRSGR
ncbi:glycerophosphodiester phosphodiesterase family protein [Humibacter ginsenosidimutans]|uniref:Glycerophosphodiester phosphodiesterase n=1 Tax=Humibacter ginsenosidimutans TaxID=2599293 RepID=A0A5B8M200_9MICO|nr:glycerophosphodiester phosphodiesterase family protein [Humibacter ginsenosidimutans]QDZ13710.1 glycerophosphodiester phosphodiesterase [Humibacter ginsenosidimutans]